MIKYIIISKLLSGVQYSYCTLMVWIDSMCPYINGGHNLRLICAIFKAYAV